MKKKNFTLIELLVVISIIAVLVSILMPSLSKARMRGKIAVCVSNQKQFGALAMIHYDSFKRVPRSGLHWATHLDATKTGDGRALPWQAALGAVSSDALRTDTFANLKADILKENIMRPFLCPADDSKKSGDVYIENNTAGWVPALTSYGANEALAGCESYTPNPGRIEGKIDLVGETSKVFLYAESTPRTIWNPSLEFYNAGLTNCTLSDLWRNSLGGHSTNFPKTRHLSIQTMVFIDGHAESIDITTNSLLRNAWVKKW